ncbi:hypothetical protein L13192_01141 [Pyrenophora tritici-repentis]|uniref:Uncharacterized protein n=1 Tax=Pyrenophora tritici-repentis TaxID=45151 RepID=A0A922NDM6_9PLEO|nr:hypothetical protein Ptr86124_007382 [Pyrenophora tritici-repentis]KAI1674394.1 hypothetical protein L13192_01141 [Pyrenophora tritici-repentis]KAI1688489.1 hypothetical protein KJE20_01666 [Pyrenophora tritici-repentis]
MTKCIGKKKRHAAGATLDWHGGVKGRCAEGTDTLSGYMCESTWIDETWVNRGLERDRQAAESQQLSSAAVALTVVVVPIAQFLGRNAG